LLNLSGKIDQDTVQLLRIVNDVTSELSVPYLVVGATARDMVMHFGYGARIQRATKDLDFAIQISEWDAFTAIKDRLVDQGFKNSKSLQRMISPSGMPVDLIPFGGIADENLNIQWPPSGEIVMDVTGFEEAFDCAMQVIVREDLELQVPVVSPQGLTLLKLIAWKDRNSDLRTKDAQDITYLLETYQSVAQVTERMYETEGMMEQYGWEIDPASAHLLGIDVAAIASVRTKSQIDWILAGNFEEGQPNHLVEEMCSNIDDEYGSKLRLLEAFVKGFNTKQE